MRILIAPKSYHRSLLSFFREEDAFADIKLFTKEDLQKICLPSFGNEALNYLIIKKNYRYDFARKILNYLTYCKNAEGTIKLEDLSKLYDELVKQDLLLDESISDFIQNKDVEIFGYSNNDCELLNCLKILNLTAKFPSFVKNREYSDVVVYEKIEDEVHLTLNQIAALIDQGVKPNNIYIFNRNEEYNYYLKKFSKLYGFNINGLLSQSWFTTGAYALFIKLYKENHDISSSLNELKMNMKDDDLYPDFEQLINGCINNEFSFDQQLDVIEQVCKRSSIKEPIYTNAVESISEPIISKDKYIFIIGFAQGYFPRTSKENCYLNDLELQKIGRLTSNDKVESDINEIKLFLQSDNHTYISYSKQSLSNQFYASPFLSILEMKNIKPLLTDYFYSKTALSYIYSDLKDKNYFYHETSDNFYKIGNTVDISYNTFDNSIKNTIDCYDSNTLLKLSTTGLDKYSNCPYSYYLSKILELDNETHFNAQIGMVCHSILESIFHKNFEFNTRFDKEIAKFDFGNDQLFFLNNFVKKQLEHTVKVIQERNNKITNPTFFTEEFLSYKLNENTYVIGRADLTEVIDNKYVVCIDYKTGSAKFDESKLQYGLSSQLPTYMLLYSNTDNFKKYDLAGIYINQIISNKYKESIKDGDVIEDYLKLTGKTLNDFKIVSMIDSTILNGKSNYLASVKLKGTDTLADSKSLISNEEMVAFQEKAKELYSDFETKLRKNIFDISPIYFTKEDNACKWCNFKDICYLRNHQIRNIVKEEDEDEQ